MPRAMDTVKSFINAWSAGKEAHHAAYRKYFRPDTVWENHGWKTTVGPDAAIATLNSANAAGVRAEIQHIAENGNVVMVERTDHITDDAGKLVTSIRVVGIFEIEDGKIAKWREYFDTKLWDNAMRSIGQ